MKKCPKCGSTRYKEGPQGKACQKCGYVNDPRYLEKKLNEMEDKDE